MEHNNAHHKRFSGVTRVREVCDEVRKKLYASLRLGKLIARALLITRAFLRLRGIVGIGQAKCADVL